MTRAILYSRQSLARKGEDESSSLSLDSQERESRRYADDRGWEVVGAVRDHDLKGWDPNRPALAEAVRAIETGEADVLIVHALDRLAADLVIQELTWRRIKAAGATLISVTEPHAENDLVRGMFGVIAQYRKTVLGDKLRAAFATNQVRGVHHGIAPYGYRHAGERSIVVNDDERESCAAILAMAAEGVRAQTIAQRLCDAGARNRSGGWWHAATIHRLTISPVYAGGLRTKGGALWPEPGVVWHEPYVDRATWDRIQSFAVHRPHVRTKAVSSWLDGRVRHACGARMYLVSGEPGNTDRTPQLRCSDAYRAGPMRCCQWPRNASLRNVEAAARTALSADLSGVLSVRRVMAETARDVATTDAKRQRSALDKQMAALTDRADRAEALYLDGRRDLAWMRGQEAEIGGQRVALESQIAALPRIRDAGEIAETVALLTSLAALMASRAGDALTPILASLGEAVVVDGCVRIAYRPDVAYALPAPTAVPIKRLQRRG